MVKRSCSMQHDTFKPRHKVTKLFPERDGSNPRGSLVDDDNIYNAFSSS
jgi:hypothetical protein